MVKVWKQWTREFFKPGTGIWTACIKLICKDKSICHPLWQLDPSSTRVLYSTSSQARVICLGPVQLERCTSMMYDRDDTVVSDVRDARYSYTSLKNASKMILAVSISLGSIMVSPNTKPVETPPSDLIYKRTNPRKCTQVP